MPTGKGIRMKTIGLVLVVVGVLALVYGGFSYNKDRTVLHMGSMNITATEQKSVSVPVLVGVAVLVGGIAILAVGKRRGVAS
jgi:hypothetical protein